MFSSGDVTLTLSSCPVVSCQTLLVTSVGHLTSWFSNGVRLFLSVVGIIHYFRRFIAVRFGRIDNKAGDLELGRLQIIVAFTGQNVKNLPV
jgi:hypothetical protein